MENHIRVLAVLQIAYASVGLLIALGLLMIFGGADIKVRKTAKERLLEFADSIRAMFEPVELRGRTGK